MQRQTYEPATTVVSLVPFPINEEKPGMSPSKFFIDPADPELGFSTLLVTKCRHGVYLDEYRPVLVVPTAPEEVAESICFDYKKGQLGIRMGEAEPGLFWVPGNFAGKEKEAELKAIFSADFREAEKLQIAWFTALVALADDGWGQFKRRGAVSMMQKIAANALKLKREWLLDNEVASALSECPICFEKVHPRAIVCRGCNGILNEAEYAKYSFARQAPPVPTTAPAPPAK